MYVPYGGEKKFIPKKNVTDFSEVPAMLEIKQCRNLNHNLVVIISCKVWIREAKLPSYKLKEYIG